MKAISVTDAAPQLGQLVLDVLNGEIVILKHGEDTVKLIPDISDSDEDFASPELEAEVLRGLEGKATPYKKGDFQEMLREIRTRKKNG